MLKELGRFERTRSKDTGELQQTPGQKPAPTHEQLGTSLVTADMRQLPCRLGTFRKPKWTINATELKDLFGLSFEDAWRINTDTQLVGLYEKGFRTFAVFQYTVYIVKHQTGVRKQIVQVACGYAEISQEAAQRVLAFLRKPTDASQASLQFEKTV